MNPNSLTENLDKLFDSKTPNVVEAARQRTADLVRNISTNTKLSLRQRRDELDNLVERISRTEAALIHFIGEFAKENHTALAISTDIAKRIEDAAVPFKSDPPATITQPSPFPTKEEFENYLNKEEPNA